MTVRNDRQNQQIYDRQLYYTYKLLMYLEQAQRQRRSSLFSIREVELSGGWPLQSGTEPDSRGSSKRTAFAPVITHSSSHDKESIHHLNTQNSFYSKNYHKIKTNSVSDQRFSNLRVHFIFHLNNNPVVSY